MSTYDDKTNYMGTGINLTDVPPLTPEGWEKLVLSETLGSLAEGASANSVSTARQALAAYRAEWDRKYNISLDKVVENADAMAAKGDMTGINARARLNAYRVDVESAQLRAQLDKPSRVHSAANDKTALQVRAVVRAGLKKIQQAITAGKLGDVSNIKHVDKIDIAGAPALFKAAYAQEDAIKRATIPHDEALDKILSYIADKAAQGEPGIKLARSYINDPTRTAFKLDLPFKDGGFDAEAAWMWANQEAIVAAVKASFAEAAKNSGLALDATSRRLELAECGRAIQKLERQYSAAVMAYAMKHNSYPDGVDVNYITAEALLGVKWAEIRAVKQGGSLQTYELNRDQAIELESRQACAPTFDQVAEELGLQGLPGMKMDYRRARR
jgi:hypothetical protein